jgi:DNA-binding response OmpR family regulator
MCIGKLPMARILHIDDEKNILRLYSEALSEHGHTVISLDSPEGVLAIIAREKPHIVILDIKFPAHNGLDVLQEIRYAYNDLPIILNSAYGSFQEDRKCWAADYYVIKSYDLTELLTKIKMALEAGVPDLSQLSFGYSTAENDITIGLNDFFFKSDSYNQVVTGRKTILLGSRGAGKTAILKVLGKEKRRIGELVIEISSGKYSFEVLKESRQLEETSPFSKQKLFESIWKDLLLVLVMHNLVKKKPKTKDSAAKAIYKYLKKHFADTDLDGVDRILSSFGEIEKVKIGPVEASRKTKKNHELKRHKGIERLIPDIMELCVDRRVWVLIDDLELDWESSDISKAAIEGVVKAAVSINQLSSNLRVLVSLRHEVFKNIPSLYADAQKLRDLVETLSWDEKSLFEIIGKRIRHTVPGLVGLNNLECWNMIFKQTTEQTRRDLFKYLIDRTLYRPRQLIQFCSDILTISRTKGVWPIDFKTILQAELAYSENQIDDISWENRLEYPGLKSIFLLFRGRRCFLKRNELTEICKCICCGQYRVDQSSEWVMSLNPDSLIEVLWKVGFLKASTTIRLNNSLEARSGYFGPHEISSINLHNIDIFQIHHMFYALLGTSEDQADQS